VDLMNEPLDSLAVQVLPLTFINTEDGEYLLNIRGVDTKILVKDGKASCPLCKKEYERLYFSLITGNILCYRCLTPVVYLFQGRGESLAENPLLVWLKGLARFRSKLLYLAKQSSLLYDTCRRLSNATTFFSISESIAKKSS